MMTRTFKVEEVNRIAEKLKKSTAAFLVDFKGIDVESVTKFRKNLRKLDAEMKVVRNTLAKRALTTGDNTADALTEDFTGTNAMIFCYSDVGATAKAITDFKSECDKIVIKSGLMDNARLDAKKIEYLSKLPGKDVLRAQLLGTLAAPMSKFVRQLAAVPSSFVRVLNAHKEKQEKGN